jgi:ankyrin
LSMRAKVDVENNVGQRALGLFSASGNVDAVKLLLGHHADADYRDRSGESPLGAAVRGGHEEVARILLQSKAVSKTINASNLLSKATLQGNAKLVDLLLSAHANINESSNGFPPPLICAIERRNREMIRLLLDRKADINIRYAGKSPVDYARATGDEEIVKMIVRVST